MARPGERITVIDEQSNVFEDENMALFLALGALSFAARLDRLLESQLSSASGAEFSPDGADQPLDDCSACLLGLIALKERFQAVTATAEPAPRTPQPRRRTSPAFTTRGLLR